MRTLALAAFIAALATSGCFSPLQRDANEPALGAKVPAVQVLTPEGAKVTLAPAIAGKTLRVLVFYRGGW